VEDGEALEKREATVKTTTKGPWVIPAWRTAVFAVLGLGTLYFCVTAPATVAGDSSGVTMHLPDRVLDFYGRREVASEAELRVLPDDTEFAKMLYVSREPFAEAMSLISCSIVLSGKDRSSIHRPQVCLDAQGWSFDSMDLVPVDLNNGEKLRVTKLALSRKEELASGRLITRRALYLYWFVGKDLAIPDSKTRVILTAWDNVFRNVNHRWAYVSVMAPITEGIQFDGKSEVETQEMLEHFMQEAVPAFQTAY
jgi:hypothetical protein